MINVPRGPSVFELFEAQVSRTPDSIAIIDDVRSVTYSELNNRANQIAHLLRDRGAGPEWLVAISMDRSAELVAALLGILKSGAAYVPIDPSYPPERITQILNDSAPAVILTQEKFLAQLHCSTERILCIENVSHQETNIENVQSNVTPENLAYVIYTSGSTGKPKGVEMMHHSVTALLYSLLEEWHMTAQDRFLAHTSISFDISVSEILIPLAIGSSLRIVDSPFTNIGKFLSGLSDPEITFLLGTPSMWRMILDSGWTGNKKLNAVSGGEALSLKLARELVEKVGSLRNMYGPTETCVWATSSIFHEEDEILTLGHPLTGAKLYVLDPDGTSAPSDSTGELCIAGPLLARGYRGDPELTSRKFIPNPFVANERLYRTGDLVRIHDGKEIEFTGRIDHQLKIRGFRIESGDVEAALTRHSSIKEAAVAARQDGSGSNMLIAFLVANGQTVPSASDLRIHLSRLLPPYMIPSLFMCVESLPVTPNGKLDRNALSRLSAPLLQEGRDSVAASGWIEETLAAIWSDLLEMKLPGAHDNFFELGGHSLFVMQLVARIQEAFGVEIPVSAIFRAPTLSELSQQISKAISSQTKAIPSIKKIDRHQEIPLSFQQEGIWFLQNLDPECTAYHFQCKLEFDGAFDRESLVRSLAEIIRRHEIYRTTFPSVAGVPVQRIHPPWIPELPVIELDGQPDPEKNAEEQMQRTLNEMRFHMERLPLIRWFLFTVGTKNILLHVEHHLVHDGWSFRLFLQELMTLYSAFSKGDASPLSEPEVQFADYAWWQKNVLWNLVKQKQFPYWEKKLSGAPQGIDLPYDHPRPKLQSYRGDAPRMHLPDKLYKSILDLARGNATTFFVTLLSAFQILIYRYTNQEDLLLSTGIGNRRTRETESIIGMFVNTVLVRSDLTGNPTFRELMARTSLLMSEVHEHQDIPFRTIVESLQPERQLHSNPLFQVMFNFHDASLRLPEISGTEITLTEVLGNASAKFDLDLIVIPPVKNVKGQEATTLIWEYSTDLFEAETIQRMMNHYVQILQHVVAQPDSKIAAISILTPAEQQQLLIDWNQTTCEYPRQKTIAEIFEQQASRSPDAPAVCDATHALTYGELNRKANQVAYHLRRLGAGAECTIAVAIPRSVELVIALLAVLKAGSAYVPLDVADPPQRIATILEDAAPAFVLTVEAEGALFQGAGQKCIRLDTDWNQIASEESTNPLSAVGGESLAYIMYTSGTTGRPKGVAVPHRAITRLVYNIRCIPLHHTDVVLQTAPVCFDVSAFEIWGALLNGAQLVLPQEHLSLQEIVDTIRQYHVTTAWLASALFSNMVAANIEGLQTLKTLVTGGDIVSRTAAEKARLHLPGVRIFNGYGPTEAAMFSSFYEVTENTSFERNIPIGVPAPNTRLFILDEFLQPVPIGVKGELCIGGDGLAREYYKDPVLTQRKFVEVPPFGRLYRTGDAARWMADGNIDFLGRMDRQLKIRGFRIEPQEVEAALLKHPAIKEAAVVPVEESADDRKLVAYVAADRQKSITVYELRTFLSQILPAYMVPSRYVFLDALPVSANGKIDRSALPPPDGERPDLSSQYVAPRNELERTIAGIWSEVLERDRIGVLDDFFELGGESLAAIRVVSRIHVTLGVHIPLRMIFEYPTISGLAQCLA